MSAQSRVMKTPRLPLLSRYVFPFFILALLCCLSALPAAASEKSRTGVIITDDKQYPPFAFLDPAGRPRGITVDIWNLWSKKTGIAVDIHLMEWDAALAAVRSGHADIVGGLFHTPGREDDYDFTKPIIRIPTAVFFHHQIAGLKGLEDLSGFRVGVVKGDSSQELLRAKYPNIELASYAGAEELVRAAIAGQVRVFVADVPVASFYLAKYPGGEAFRKSAKDIALNLQYAAVRKGNKEMLAVVQSGLERISEEEISAIVAEWSGRSTQMAVPWRGAGMILSVMVLLAVAVLAWTVQLRRRVVRATRELTEKNRELELSRDAMQLSEARYRELVQNANSIILRMDRDGNVTFINEYAQQFLGFRPEEIIGRNVIGTIVPERETTGRDLSAMIKDIARNPDQYTTNENENMRRDGGRIWIAWTNRPFFDADGQVREILCVGNDITDRRLMEEALRESEERYRTLFEHANEAVFVAQDGRIVFHNPRTVEMTGYSAEELRSGSFITFIHEDDRDMVMDRHIRRLKGEALPHRYAFRIIHRDGDNLWVELNAVLIQWNGKPATLNFMGDISERLRMVELLRESEQRATLAIQGTGAGLWDWDMIRDRVVYSAQWKSMLGYADHEVANTFEGWKKLWHPEDAPGIEKAIQDHIAGETRHYETIHRLRHKDGDWRWILTRGEMTRDAQGKPRRWVGTNLDITAQKRAEEALRISEKKYRHLFESAVEGILITRGEVIEFANPALARILGRSIEAITSSPFISFIHPEDRDMVLERHRRRMRGETVETGYDFRIVVSGGETRFLRITSQVIDWDRTPASLSFLTDITERKLAEEALRKSQAKYRLLFDSAAEGIVIIQGEIIRFANPAILEILGYPQDIVTSRPFVAFIHPEDRAMVLERHRRRMRGEKVETGYSFRIISGDEKVKWLRIFSRVIMWEEVQSIMSFLIDITDHKHAEEERIEIEKRLQQAQRLESIGTLAGGIAHDFNNLLMGIQGYASLMLLDLDISHPHYERLRRIEEQVQSGADLTRQLLGFARGGRYEAKPSDINEILEKTSSMFGRTKKEITIHRKAGRDLWNVEVDRGQMEQVFINLYVNAWHAMPGGGDIYIETENVTLGETADLQYTVKPGKYIKISITDTGTGMDEKTRERIFDPFFTTKEMGRGTGLGLATVYGIIKGHKGMINVDSEPGHGTAFTIYLPASEKSVETEERSAGTMARGTETILLVDDERMVLDVNRELLGVLGYRVYAVASGQEAIAVYLEKRNEIDLVILDTIMPGLSGGETFDRLREIKPDVRVLLSSGYSINGEARAIMDRGCSGFLQKPFLLAALSQKVREILD